MPKRIDPETEEKIIERLNRLDKLKENLVHIYIQIAKEFNLYETTIRVIEKRAITEGRLDRKYGIKEQRKNLEAIIIERLKKPGTISEIRREFRQDWAMIKKILLKGLKDGRLNKEHARKPNNPPLNGEINKKIINRLKIPGTLQEIAREFNRAPETIRRIQNDAIKDGRLNGKYRRMNSSKTMQWQYDKIINIIKEKQKYSQPIIFNQIASEMNPKVTRSIIKRIYWELVNNWSLSLNEEDFIGELDPEIKEKYRELSGKNKRLFMGYMNMNRYSKNFKIPSAKELSSIIELVFRKETEKKVREIASEFVMNYPKLKLDKYYTLRNFANNSYWIKIRRRISKSAVKERKTFNEYFISLLKDPLRQQAEDIISGERYRRELKENGLEEAVKGYLSS